LAGRSKAKMVAGKIANGVGNAMVIAGITIFDCGLDFMFYTNRIDILLFVPVWVHNKMHFYRLIPTFSKGEGGVQFVMHPPVY